MKNLKYIGLALLMLLSATSCEDALDNNVNPDKSSTATPQSMLPVVVFYASQINYDHAEYGTYLSNTLTTASKSQRNSYAYKGGWEFLTMNRHPQWRRHFYDLGANINELIDIATEAKSYNFVLIARSIRLMSTQLTTDMFGDMPRSEAYTSNSPKYDTQESIYEWMLQEADELIALYDDASWTDGINNIPITSSMDRIFNGDLAKWRQFTCAMKARILLRKLPNLDNTPETCLQIIDAVDAALVDWEDPRYEYNNENATGVANCPWGPSKPTINSWESRSNLLDKAIVSKYFCVDVMGVFSKYSFFKGYAEDPRLEKLMKARSGPATDPAKKFRYLENNIGMGVSYQEKNYPDLYESVLTRDNSYISLFTKEELLLIKAEATYWKGDKTGARALTLEATLLNMERLGVTKTAWIEEYTDGDYKTKYFPEGNAFTIHHLMLQKYICMYLQPEQWTDMRRYCYSNNVNKETYDGVIVYPTLKRPYNLYEPYWVVDDDGDGAVDETWIQRINYDPETEEKYNRLELERLGAYRNADWLKKPMIWAVYDGQHN
ncbi:MAG: SusD/RagB family nutrient-binding outer membrane lipoprotein [Bacteroidaceae bacterium]